MGMDYFIYPDKETDCSDDFPERLSNFFEQVQGLGNTAEAEQVGRILGIDLSIFQQVEDSSVDDNQQSKKWQHLDKFISVVDTFIAKINQQPDYYNKVQYNPDTQNHGEILSEMLMRNDTAQIQQWYEKMQEQPLHDYPIDRGYLSSGAILSDLQELRNTLSCYSKSGVTKVMLVYM
jgi:hypothetical protein